jgi:hypothetical protein
MDIAANITAHRATPELSLDRYVKSRVVELGKSLDGRTAIYLDTKFWIILEKVARGRSNEEADGELLSRLRRLTAAGRVFCPISESIFMELMKQADATSRLAMTRLIDELSHGVTLIAYDMRIGTELAHFLQRFAGNRDDLDPLHHLVWSKLAYVLGFVHPASMPCDAAMELAVQKAFFDLMWGMPLEAMVQQADKVSPPAGLDFADLAANLNAGSAQHASEIRSFEQAYDAELRGVVDACGDQIIGIVCKMAEDAGTSPPSRGSAKWLESQRLWKSAVYQSLKKESGKENLRSMHVDALLHAAFRWDKGRKFTGNDIYDFQHAAAALAHCGAFFTEHSLRTTIVTNRKVALDRLYGCHVVSNVSDAVAYLQALEARQAA